MHINKKLLELAMDLMESQHAITDNPGRGYHGTVDPKIHNSKSKSSPLNGDEERARAHHYKKMHGLVRSLTGDHPKIVKHYLDSVHGRHLADVHNDNNHRKLSVGNVHNYIKKDFASFKRHYRPTHFESYIDHGLEETLEEHLLRMQEEEDLGEALYVPKNFNKHETPATKDKSTFVKGVHGKEHEHIKYIKSAASSHGGKEISDEHAKKVAHSPEYHAHVYNYRHDFKRGGSNGLDNGIKRLAGTHPHAQNEETEKVDEMFADSGSFKSGDKVIVKNPSSPLHNKRGIYAGKERGRHVVTHGDGARSFHGDGALLKESTKLSTIWEATKSADKKPEISRTASGKLVTKMVTRKQDVVDAGGKDKDNESMNESTEYKPNEGDKVKIIGQKMEHAGKKGTVHQISPTGTHVGVKNKKGEHIGYYHISDVKKLDESEDLNN